MASVFNPEHQNKSVDSKIVAGFERISEAFRVMLWEQSKQLKISPIQIQILIFLQYQTKEKRKVGYLAKEFNMTKPTISDAVKSLEQKELIKKTTEKSDSRSYTMQLTAKGKKVVKQTDTFTQAIEQAVAGISKSKKSAVLESLFGIIHNLTESGVITMQRMCRSCQHFEQLGETALFCNLLHIQLTPEELRIDCPEHEFVEGE